MPGPLGDVPGMSFDPIRNRYFPIPKGPRVNQTEEDTRPLPSSSSSSPYSTRAAPSSSQPSAESSSSDTGYQNVNRSRNGSALNPNVRSYVPNNVPPPNGSRTRSRSNQPQQNNDQRQPQNQARDRGQSQASNQGNSRSPQLQSQSTNYSSNNRRNDQMRSFELITIPQFPCFINAQANANGQNLKRARSGSSSKYHDDSLAKSRLPRVGGLRKGKFGINYSGIGVGNIDRNLSMQDKILSNLELDVEHHACGCHGEIITSYKAYGEEAYYATTDHGKLIMHHGNGDTAVFSVCAQNLVGMHCDVPRLTMIAIAGGSEPHLHLFKRNPEMLDHVFITQSELDLHKQEIYGLCSFDDICTLGGAKSLTTIKYTSSLHAIPRKLPSDALAIHQNSRDLVYVGQRSGHVSLEDLRTNTRTQNVVASTLKGKAVVGVKRLKDSAVPWGLVVSGMSHEMLLFDVRFGDKPLKVFEGHFNTFHSSVALTTTPDDQTLFSSTSDRRIKGWSILSGEPLNPSSSITPDSTSSLRPGWNSPIPSTENKNVDEDDNPLNKVFDHRVTHMDINDELGLDVVVRGDLYRFSRR